MPEFHFEPVARLQRYLGKELIAEPNIAIIEFVKNSYDAYASQVLINFEIKNRAKEQQVITISDNGTGMDAVSFEKNWMHPAYSWKARLGQPSADTSVSTSADQVQERVPVGEKGLGRLAAGRLGDKIHIYTRTKEDQPWLHVYIDWTEFETMDKPLNQVPVAYEETAEGGGAGFPKGTIVIIEGLLTDWAGKLPGRRVAGRSNYRLGRLIEDLNIAMQPLPREQRDFAIYVECDSEELQEFNGWIEPSETSFLDYKFMVSIREDENGIYIDRSVSRSEDVASKVGRPQVTESKGLLNELYDEKEQENVPTTLVCGPFSAVLNYSPVSSKRLKELEITPGVFLYRDGMRVEPYGQEGNDWLGVMAWKASRQGYAPIQPKNLSGYFIISRIKNPELRDMSNRQGLVDNDEYCAFLALARSEFRWFADLVFLEYVEPRWESSEEKARRAAQSRQAFGIAIIRSIIHSIRQSTAGLGAELSVLKDVIQRGDMAEETQEKLKKIQEHSWAHLKMIEDTVQRYITFDQEQLMRLESFGEIVLQDMLQEAVSRAKPLADSKGVKILMEQVPKYSVVFNKEILVAAVNVLISNGIEAAYSGQRQEKWVKILVTRSNGEYEILIKDNGMGIEPSKAEELFLRSLSDKGRPGVGLMLMREGITSAGGKISLQSTGKDGSIFKISLPPRKEFRVWRRR